MKFVHLCFIAFSCVTVFTERAIASKSLYTYEFPKGICLFPKSSDCIHPGVVVALPTLSFGFAAWSIRNIPKTVRSASAYTTGEERLLDRNILTVRPHLGLGTRISLVERVVVSTEFSYWNNGGGNRSTIAEQSFSPRDEYVGYVLKGWNMSSSVGYRSPIGFTLQMGYRVSWMRLQSGSDAYSEFSPQNEIAIPGQVIFGVVYQIPEFPEILHAGLFVSASPESSPRAISTHIAFSYDIPFVF